MTNGAYLDYNATTPLHPQLLSFVAERIKVFGNPSSVHQAGREAKRLITQARESLASFLHIDSLDIVFTAGGSEGNNLALKGVAALMPEKRREIICSRVEHPSVLKTVESLANHGFKIKWLEVKKDGSLDLEGLEGLLSDHTALVSVQYVNNETGNIFPIKEVAQRAHARGALVHSDMVQALGKLKVDLKDLGVDLATFAGHKFYSLKGAGFLYVKRGTRLEPLIRGGGQERSRRAGTENALAIACLGEAVRVLGPAIDEMNQKVRYLRDGLEEKCVKNVSAMHINGQTQPRVSNTSSMTFAQTDGETLLINLDTRGFAVSSGAACSSGSQEPSPVLRAMGFSAEEASQTLRMSLGWLTTQEQVDGFFESLKISLELMRESRRSADE